MILLMAMGVIIVIAVRVRGEWVGLSNGHARQKRETL